MGPSWALDLAVLKIRTTLRAAACHSNAPIQTGDAHWPVISLGIAFFNHTNQVVGLTSPPPLPTGRLLHWRFLLWCLGRQLRPHTISLRPCAGIDPDFVLVSLHWGRSPDAHSLEHGGCSHTAPTHPPPPWQHDPLHTESCRIPLCPRNDEQRSVCHCYVRLHWHQHARPHLAGCSRSSQHPVGEGLGPFTPHPLEPLFPL